MTLSEAISIQNQSYLAGDKGSFNFIFRLQKLFPHNHTFHFQNQDKEMQFKSQRRKQQNVIPEQAINLYTFSKNNQYKMPKGWLGLHCFKKVPKCQNYNESWVQYTSGVSDKTDIIMGYVAKAVGKTSQAFHPINSTAVKQPTQPNPSTKGTVEPQVWKTSSKPTDSNKIFIIKMGSDQEEPEQQHLNIQEVAKKMKGGKNIFHILHVHEANNRQLK